MERREEPALGVRLLAPAGWRRTDRSGGGAKVLVFTPTEKDPYTRISLIVAPASSMPAGLETREAAVKAVLGTSYRRVRLETGALFNRPATVLEYVKESPPAHRTIEYGLRAGNKFYVVQFAAAVASWPELEPPFKTALASLELFDVARPTNESTAMVPMRDGVRLSTYVVLPPPGTGPAKPGPALLIRSPYFQYLDHWLETFRPFTEQGYALVYQSVRGTGESEGQLDPMRQELADGQDTVRWIVTEPWSNRIVGTVGSSYDGFTALAAAVDTPEVKLVLADGAPIRAFETWPATQNGAILASLLWWDRTAKGLPADNDDVVYRRTVTNSRPVRELDLAAFGALDPVWRGTLPFMEKRSAYWDDRSLTDKLSRICAPVITMQAKNEYASDGLDAFLSLSAKACNDQVRAAHRFVLHAGDHGEAIYHPFASTPAGDLIRASMARYLEGKSVVLDASPTHYFVQNANEWHAADRWPVSERTSTYYLDARSPRLVPTPKDHPARIGELSVAKPSAEGSVGYTFDPASDDACSPDVFTERLAFEGPKLPAALDLVGRAELVLFVTIDTPDTDIFATLLDGATGNHVGQGVGMRLRFRRSMAAPEPMRPGQVAEVHLQLNAEAFRFAKGSSVLVALASTTCGLSENPNTGGSMTDETKTRPVKVQILTGPAHPSRLIVPLP